jgi:hypothetical protein
MLETLVGLLERIIGESSMKDTTKYLIGLFAALCLSLAANLFHFLRRVTCMDCFFPYGLPFTFFREGGEGGGGGFVWLGFVGDLLVIIIIGAAIGSVWSWYSGRKLK